MSCQILTFFLLEQILYNIKQEYKRMQKRRHLETSFQQTDPCCTSDAQPHAFLLSGPASPGNKRIDKCERKCYLAWEKGKQIAFSHQALISP